MAALIGIPELAARWAVRRRDGYYRYKPYARTHIRLDRTALPRMKGVVRTEINGDGERGGVPPRRGEHAYRALVMGGSVAECTYLDQDQTWPAVIERVLNEPAHLAALGGVKRVHVGSAARATFPCEQIAAMARKMLPRYRRLDLLVLMVGASDLDGLDGAPHA